MLILIEGIVLCFILLIFCVIGIANGPEKFTVFYEKDGETYCTVKGSLEKIMSFSEENEKYTKQALVEYLEKNGIGTRQLFAGNILRQPMFVENEIQLRINDSEILNSKDLNETHYKMLPNADYIMNNTFWVGTFPNLDEKHMDKISDTIHKFFMG